MQDLNPSEILKISAEKGYHKANSSVQHTLVKAVLGGVFIALGYWTYMRLVVDFSFISPAVGRFIGASFFPVGLMFILVAGGELLTGNFLDVGSAYFAKRVSFIAALRNFALVLIGNAIGAFLTALFFGRVLSGFEGAYLTEIIHVAHSKLSPDALNMFFSGIGCNILVGLSVWMAHGAKQHISKLALIWFPVMLFVYLGLQHSVANLFVFFDAMLLGELGFVDILPNLFWVVLGNGVGGFVFLAGVYTYLFKEH